MKELQSFLTKREDPAHASCSTSQFIVHDSYPMDLPREYLDRKIPKKIQEMTLDKGPERLKC